MAIDYRDIANSEHISEIKAKRVTLANDEGTTIDVQNPLPTDGDSIYKKDIDLSRSVLDGFSGVITDIFDDSSSSIINSSGDNPKGYTVYFKRPITTAEIIISAGQGGTFSNAKLYLYDIAGNERLSKDNSTDSTLYTEYVFNNRPQTFIGYRLEFHTINTINIAFNCVHKSIEVHSTLKVLDSDTGLLIDVDGHRGHMKNLSFLQAIGYGVTNDTIIVERANGEKTGIGTGAYTLLESHPFVQPPDTPGNVQFYLQSTSIEDSATGLGAQELTLEYFSIEWGQRKIITIIPDGTTQVVIPLIDKYRIHKLEVTAGNPAYGDITITDIGETVLYGQIDQYNTYMERCIFYVAENETVTCTQGKVTSVTNAGVRARLFVSEESATGNVVTRGRLPITVIGGSVDFPLNIPESVSNPNNKRIALGIAVKSAGIAANQSANGTLKGFRRPTAVI